MCITSLLSLSLNFHCDQRRNWNLYFRASVFSIDSMSSTTDDINSMRDSILEDFPHVDMGRLIELYRYEVDADYHRNGSKRKTPLSDSQVESEQKNYKAIANKLAHDAFDQRMKHSNNAKHQRYSKFSIGSKYHFNFLTFRNIDDGNRIRYFYFFKYSIKPKTYAA